MRAIVMIVLAAVAAIHGGAEAARAGQLFESTAHPEIQRVEPILPTINPTIRPPGRGRTSTAPAGASTQPAGTSTQDVQTTATETLGPNLIQNPSVETAGSSGLPEQWFKGGYGTNTRLLTYPVPGYQSPKGLEVLISGYTSGDAKWYFADVPVSPGTIYQFSDFYLCNIASTITAQFKLSNGAFAYQDLGTLNASSAYQNATVRFTAPAGAVSVTIFHLIRNTGTLRTDEFSLNEVEVTSDPNNLVSNPGFETAGTNNQPVSWSTGRWGTNTTTFSYPVTGVAGSRAAKVAMSSYTSGDAKWVHAAVPVSRGVYMYSTQYQATPTTIFTAQLEQTNGTLTYKNLATVAPSSPFAGASAELWIPFGVQRLTVFHLIKNVGQLINDDVAIKFTAAPTGIFTTGAVSLTFDDGWRSQYDVARPKLDSAGLKATFYIITQQLADNGFPGYMTKAQVVSLSQQGHEIGAHTRTHRSLTTLSSTEQQQEIAGSRQDLLNMSVGPVLSFAYPFGDYNSAVIQLVKDAGLQSARCSLGGRVTPVDDEYQLARFSVENTTTFSQVKQAIDAAQASQEWLILVFHQIATGADRYTTSPTTFNQIVDYLVQTGIPVIPVSQGIPSMR